MFARVRLHVSPTTGEAHLTHLVRDVRGVDRLIDSQGVDCGLVIVSGAATTWLRVLP